MNVNSACIGRIGSPTNADDPNFEQKIECADFAGEGRSRCLRHFCCNSLCGSIFWLLLRDLTRSCDPEPLIDHYSSYLPHVNTIEMDQRDGRRIRRWRICEFLRHVEPPLLFELLRVGLPNEGLT